MAVFLPTDPEQREDCKQAVSEMIEVQGQRLLGWRALPTDPSWLSAT